MLSTGKLVAAGALWTAALLLGAIYILVWREEREIGLWAILIGMVAQCVTQSLMLDRHRMRVTASLAVMEAERHMSADVRPIR